VAEDNAGAEAPAQEEAKEAPAEVAEDA